MQFQTIEVNIAEYPPLIKFGHRPRWAKFMSGILLDRNNHNHLKILSLQKGDLMNFELFQTNFFIESCFIHFFIKIKLAKNFATIKWEYNIEKNVEESSAQYWANNNHRWVQYLGLNGNFAILICYPYIYSNLLSKRCDQNCSIGIL